jgi:AAA domain, putative AbiEii toxin, Type IV TA system/AAA ATPase domain
LSQVKSQLLRAVEAIPSVEYHMLKTFKAHNFRCFQRIELSDLRRVNIVVGKNAAGKTALLEAIRLGLAGTPQVLFQMNNARGFHYYLPQPMTRELFESLWNLYFYNLDPNNHILTECGDSDGRKATLKIFYDPKKAVTPVYPGQVPPGGLISTIIPITFDRTDFSGKHSQLHGTVHQQGGLNLENGPELGTVSEFYSSSFQSNPQQTAQWYSQLSIQKREHEVLEAVMREYGSLINGLAVLAPTQFPAVYADLPHMKEKLPLALVSSGVNKFVTILSALLTRSRGVLLIDEIENGLYYETFEFLWKTLLSLAVTHQTQIFASTHSIECIRALLPTLKANEQDFTLLRAERTEGISIVTPITGDFFEAALEQQFEVR